jgi:hypothetical protein
MKITRRGYVVGVGRDGRWPSGRYADIRIEGSDEAIRLSIDEPTASALVTAESLIRTVFFADVELTIEVKDAPEFHDLEMDRSG